MGKNKTNKPARKLSVKKETLRTLSTLTDDQLQNAAGGIAPQPTTHTFGCDRTKCCPTDFAG